MWFALLEKPIDYQKNFLEMKVIVGLDLVTPINYHKAS
jgi:hypothetical protein